VGLWPYGDTWRDSGPLAWDRGPRSKNSPKTGIPCEIIENFGSPYRYGGCTPLAFEGLGAGLRVGKLKGRSHEAHTVQDGSPGTGSTCVAPVVDSSGGASRDAVGPRDRRAPRARRRGPPRARRPSF